MNEEKTKAMRVRSGHIVIHSRLVSFLYNLMRDHMPVGDVETLVQDAEDEPDVIYTNGWLANYAADLADRLSDKK